MHQTHHQLLDPEKFAAVCGAPGEPLPTQCLDFLQGHDFRYRPLTGAARDAAILETLNTIASDRSDSSGKHRIEKWENGWSDNLKSFAESGDLTKLTPGYIKPGRVLRLEREYVETSDPDFLINFYTAFRKFLFAKYLSGYPEIFEFGCGTGINLILMAQMFPEANLHGLDWTAASVEILNTVVQKHGYRIKGERFDMFNPNPDLEIPQGSAVITLNAMEQLGEDHGTFLDYLLEKRPALCINSEPLYELYQEDHLLDHLALRYHEKRNYLKGLLPRLRELEAKGALEILTTQRVPFGIQFHEAYSYVVWRPR